MSWRKLFTPIDELEKQEPQIIKMENLDCVFDEILPENRGKCKGANPAALLENAYQWKCNKSPPTIYNQSGEGIDSTFECVIAAGRYKCNGIAKSKDDAHQIAAYNILREIVEKDEFADYSLPGDDKAEALAYLESIKPAILNGEVPNQSNDDEVYSKRTDQDYKGMSITLCSHKNLGHQPKYECDAGLGPSHQRRFTCTVSFPGVDDISAVGTQKKFAESWAAFKMYKQLEKLPDVPKVEKDECC